jgi:hypothetical protein
VVTPAEEKVLRLVRDGLTNAEVADRLGLTANTVKYHVANLLAKAGVSSREELRDWRPGGRRNPLRVMAPIAPTGRWLWIGAGAAGAAVAGLLVLAVALSLSSQDEALPPPVSAIDTVLSAARAFAGPDLADDRVAEVPSIALVTYDAAVPRVAVVETASGVVLAMREVSYSPAATFRRSRNELLVSHMPRADETGRLHVLDIYDLSDRLALKRRIPVADRPNYHVYSTTVQALSNDERYFAIYSFTMRTELPECNGGGDGPSCTRSKVRVIDLESALPEEWLVELPRHCFGGLSAYGPDGFLATCGDSAHVLVRSQVSTVDAAPSMRFEIDPVTAKNRANGVYWVSDSGGWYGTLLSQGSFVWIKEGEGEISQSAVPSAKQPRWPILAEVGGGRLVVGYMERYYDQYPEGLAVFDMETGVIERTLPGFDISRSIVAVGPDELMATTQDGRLIRIHISTGQATTVADLAADPENVALVR